MKLSLHIIRKDLEAYALNGKVRASVTARALDYPASCETLPDTPRSNILYIMAAESLPATPPSCARLSIICSGKPASAWLNGPHDVLWTDGIDTAHLMNELARLFWSYGDWDARLRAALSEGKPLQEVAEIAQPFFANPIALLSATFRLLFVSFPDVKEPSERYLSYRATSLQEGGGFIRDADVVSVVSDEQFERISSAKHPVVFDTAAYDYATLVYNVTAGGKRCAYLCIDEIAAPLTPRDHALAKYLGDLIGSTLTRDEDIYLLTHPEVVRDTLRGLVEHRKLVTQGKIDQTMRFFGWEDHDEFVAVVIAMRAEDEKPKALDALSASVAQATGDDCYLIIGDTALFVFDLSRRKGGRDGLMEELKTLLGPLMLTASVSTCFEDFKDLYYYYRQAVDAGRIGWKKDPTDVVRPVEADAADFIASKLVDGTIAGVHVPDGLRALMRHDAERGTGYVRLLGAFLENERNTAMTTRQEFMHRSTFNYQLARITEILGMDLNDPDERFRLIVAYRVLAYLRNDE